MFWFCCELCYGQACELKLKLREPVSCFCCVQTSHTALKADSQGSSGRKQVVSFLNVNLRLHTGLVKVEKFPFHVKNGVSLFQYAFGRFSRKSVFKKKREMIRNLESPQP